MSGPTELGPRDPRVVGPYRLLKRLGGGGQGTVYLGTSAAGDQVAVKVLNADFQDTGRLKTALNRELAGAQSVAAFVTAQVIAFDLDADPPYIVTEFVDGPTLQDEVLTGRGPLRGSRLGDLAIQTALALEAIHAANVIHCDFKPGNIILGPGGVKVIDFGVARVWDSLHQAASKVIGSAHFMAPEQVDNLPLGPPVDMFAWASTMVFAATGDYTFPGSNPVAVGLRVVQDEPDLHGLTGPLADLVLACLQKDPARRPTAAEVRQALMAPAGQRPPATARPPLPTAVEAPDTRLIAGRRPPAPDTVTPPVRRRRGRLSLVLAAALLLALVGAGAGWAWRQWDRGAGPVTPSAPPDPDLVALQTFAGHSLDGCGPLPATDRHVLRRSCIINGAPITYSLYESAPDDERAAERKRVIANHDKNSPEDCRRAVGISADGRRGEYIEYTYRADDDQKWYVAIWWDDGIDNPGKAGVMTMRQPWDGSESDPARTLRAQWLALGFKFAE